MATFAIESNGRLEKTAVYYNGQQLAGIKEVFLNLDEEGAFDAVIQYEGSDKQIHNKQIFTDYLTNVKTSEPSFTDEEAAQLQLVQVESNGDIESTSVFINEIEMQGIVSMYLHIKVPTMVEKSGLASVFSKKEKLNDETFKAEITFRYDDGEVETEEIF
jgi:hypothetical protein